MSRITSPWRIPRAPRIGNALPIVPHGLGLVLEIEPEHALGSVDVRTGFGVTTGSPQIVDLFGNEQRVLELLARVLLRSAAMLCTAPPSSLRMTTRR